LRDDTKLPPLRFPLPATPELLPLLAAVSLPEDGFVRKNIGDGVIQHLHRICFDADPRYSTKQQKKNG
jgi:hypothetical protein